MKGACAYIGLGRKLRVRSSNLLLQWSQNQAILKDHEFVMFLLFWMFINHTWCHFGSRICQVWIY